MRGALDAIHSNRHRPEPELILALGAVDRGSSIRLPNRKIGALSSPGYAAAGRHAVLSLLAAIGSVEEHHDGTVTVKVGPRTEYLDPPASKDIDPQMVADLRRLLAQVGYQG